MILLDLRVDPKESRHQLGNITVRLLVHTMFAKFVKLNNEFNCIVECIVQAVHQRSTSHVQYKYYIFTCLIRIIQVNFLTIQ